MSIARITKEINDLEKVSAELSEKIKNATDDTLIPTYEKALRANQRKIDHRRKKINSDNESTVSFGAFPGAEISTDIPNTEEVIQVPLRDPSLDRYFGVPPEDREKLIRSVTELSMFLGVKRNDLETKSDEELLSLKNALKEMLLTKQNDTTELLINFYISAAGIAVDCGNPFLSEYKHVKLENFEENLSKHKARMIDCLNMEFERYPRFRELASNISNGFLGIAGYTTMAAIQSVKYEKKTTPSQDLYQQQRY